MLESNTMNMLQAGINSPVAWNKVGMRMIEYTLYDAKEHFRNPTEKSRQTLAFISGTGMKIILETFHIGYDYQRLAEAFFDYFNLST